MEVGELSVELRVLGPLEVRLGDRPVPVPAGRARVLLASLLLRADEVVPTDLLIDRLWDGAPPTASRARATLQMVVTRLRQALGEANVVRTVADGYLAEVPPGSLDLHRYRELVARRRFAEALALWRGEPLVDVRSDSLHREEVAPLLEERLGVLERRVDADLAVGRAAELVPELRALTRQYPLRERLWAQLVAALHRADRQAEALAAYREVREQLVDELGVEPGPALREVHRRVLGDEPAPRGPAVPRQLPAPPPFFTGRGDAIAALDEAASGGGAVISAVNGTAGVGKTALAVHWAHRVANRFPDGQLHANLRGFDVGGEPVPPRVVLRGFLDALGVSPATVPPTVDEMAAMYRSLLADRRVLVLLDNARDADQVRPLLPAGPRCAVLVTSRNQLTGLVAGEGAAPLTLGLLDAGDSVVLLRRRLGARRVDADAGAIDELVARCAGLPLALNVVAARAAVNPRLPLRALVDELADEETRLDALETGDRATSVRTALSWSYRRLSPAAARLFRLLGVAAGRDVPVAAAASLAGLPVGRTRRVLGELTGAHLLTEHEPGRYAWHDLLRAYAAELVQEHETAAERRAAVRRLLDFHLHSAHRAGALMSRHHAAVPLTTPDEAVHPVVLADRDGASAWCEVEHRNLVEAVGLARRHGFPEHGWRLPNAMWPWLNLRQDSAEWTHLSEIALEAARAVGDEYAEALSLHTLGCLAKNRTEYDSALRLFEDALRLRERVGDVRGTASTVAQVAGVYSRTGRFEEACRLHVRAIELSRALPGADYTTVTLNNYADTLTRMGEYERALAPCLEAMETCLRADQDLLASVKDTLGVIYLGLGRFDLAIGEFTEILALPRHLLSARQEVFALDNLATALEATGDAAGARDALRRALEVLERDANPRAEEVRARLAELVAG
ncbi:AfsR/SARP family transcriptional regulator [Saccharothrix lopnurensis]|uniref:BTAD domain-containing putative transcriptional regulator n=1 Tax=Saccharothrix lopnurensis TaxID=1670621 RepID=A0ABW1P1H1_9PSEU